MISFLRRHQKSVFAATLTIFFGGMFVGFGGYWFEKRDLQGVVARVGGAKILYSTLMAQVELYEDQAQRQGKELTDAQLKELKQELLNGMMVDELLAQKADELGFVVSDAELARDIRGTPAFRRDGRFDEESYIALLRERFRMTPQEFEIQRRKALKAALVQSLLMREAKVSPAELREAYAAANKGSMKGFDKNKDAALGRLQQEHARGLLGRLLQQMQAKVEVQNLLSKVDAGA
ncbi:MAG: SurA N-terminal domain-containing protein [Elusimicrobia bacterium]|nr:SurA N-terminal domain-containing protein [Elusimicrobiota bacterium]